MDQLTKAYDYLALVSISVLALLIIACLIRCVRGPRVTDRIVAVNSIGTMTIIIIAILTVVMDESYLGDICLIYAMISFVAVIVLTKIYTGVYRQEHMEEKKEETNMEIKEEGKKS